MNNLSSYIIYGLIAFFIISTIFKIINRISITKAKELLAQGAKLIDVRENSEFFSGHIKNAINIPLGSIESISQKTDKQDKLIVYCQTGARSNRAYRKLKSMGYEVYDFGGIGRWK